MIKRTKIDPFRLFWKTLKPSYQVKGILMSELGRSRASAHEHQLIDGGDFKKKDFNEVKRKALQ